MPASPRQSVSLPFLSLIALLWIEVAFIWYILVSSEIIKQPLYFIVGCSWLATLVLAHYAHLQESTRRNSPYTLFGALLFSLSPLGIFIATMLIGTSSLEAGILPLFIGFLASILFVFIIVSTRPQKRKK